MHWDILNISWITGLPGICTLLNICIPRTPPPTCHLNVKHYPECIPFEKGPKRGPLISFGMDIKLMSYWTGNIICFSQERTVRSGVIKTCLKGWAVREGFELWGRFRVLTCLPRLHSLTHFSDMAPRTLENASTSPLQLTCLVIVAKKEHHDDWVFTSSANIVKK